MAWYVLVAHFFGGAFVANALPHLLAALRGRPFPTPFATPPFRALSSPRVNAAWSAANLGVAFVLLVRIGPLDIASVSDVTACLLGFVLMAFQVSRSLSRIGAE